MIRVAATLTAGALVGIPLVIQPSGLVAGFAMIAAVLSAAAIAGARRPLATAGAATALIEYAAALWQAAIASDIITAAGVGVSMLLFLEVVDFSRRVRGAVVARAALARHLRYWLTLAGVSIGVTGAMAILASALVIELPVAASAAVAATGALAAFLGAIGLLGRSAAAVPRARAR